MFDGLRCGLEFSDLPLWRKLVLLNAMGIWFYIGGMAFSSEVNVYTDAPASPAVTSGRIYPVHVMHGYVRYCTLRERQELAMWRTRTSWIGVCALAMFLTLATFKPPKPTS